MSAKFHDGAPGVETALSEMIAKILGVPPKPKKTLDLGPEPEGYLAPFSGDDDERFAHIPGAVANLRVARLLIATVRSEISREAIRAAAARGADTDELNEIAAKKVCPACVYSVLLNAANQSLQDGYAIDPNTRTGLAVAGATYKGGQQAVAKLADSAGKKLMAALDGDYEAVGVINDRDLDPDEVARFLAYRDAQLGKVKGFSLDGIEEAAAKVDADGAYRDL